MTTILPFQGIGFRPVVYLEPLYRYLCPVSPRNMETSGPVRRDEVSCTSLLSGTPGARSFSGEWEGAAGPRLCGVSCVLTTPKGEDGFCLLDF